jgi:hypothetical protein
MVPFNRRTREPVAPRQGLVVHAGTCAFGEPEIAPFMHSISKPHSMFIDDPELPFERLSFEQGHDPLERGEYMRLVLPLQSQHQEPRVFCRRERLDVRKVGIQCHQRSALLLANLGYVSVRVPTEPLVEDGQGIVSSFAQADGDL